MMTCKKFYSIAELPDYLLWHHWECWVLLAKATNEGRSSLDIPGSLQCSLQGERRAAECEAQETTAQSGFQAPARAMSQGHCLPQGSAEVRHVN